MNILSRLSPHVFIFTVVNTYTENVLEAPQFIQSTIHVSEQYVFVEALASVNDAMWVELEPETTQDWELLEIFAETLEAGSLLGQISIVYPGQRFSLRLGNDGAKVAVKSFGVGSMKEEVPRSLPSCLRLVSDTEVIIIPKPRGEIVCKEYAPSQPFRVIPNESDFSSDMKKLKRLRQVVDVFDDFIPCPPFFTAWIHPDTLVDVQGWNQVHDENEHGTPSVFVELRRKDRQSLVIEEEKEGSTVVQLAPSNIVPMGCIGKSLCDFTVLLYGTSQGRLQFHANSELANELRHHVENTCNSRRDNSDSCV